MTSDDRIVAREDFQADVDRHCWLMARPGGVGGSTGWPPRIPGGDIMPVPEDELTPPEGPPVGIDPPGTTGPGSVPTDLQAQVERVQTVLAKLEQMPNLEPTIKNMILERLIRDLVASITGAPAGPIDPGFTPLPYYPDRDGGGFQTLPFYPDRDQSKIVPL